MDIEKLTKSQIILLTLFVSFVTSIATGIVTVTLVDQAPPVITQTLERVVERTVEKVAPSDQAAAAVVTTEKTVVVKEADLITQAIAKTSPSVVRLYTGVPDALEFLGLGFVVSKSGVITTDLFALPEEGSSLYIVLADGTVAKASVLSRQSATGLALLQGATSTPNGKVAWRSGVISGSTPTLGQTVVAIGGKGSTRIDDGIVTVIPSGGGRVLETNIPRASIYPGSPLIDTDGNMVGISTGSSRNIDGGAFITASAVLSHIKTLSQ